MMNMRKTATRVWSLTRTLLVVITLTTTTIGAHAQETGKNSINNKTVKTMVITDENFQEVMDGGKPVVIDFWATWCGPCRMVGPIIEELAETYKDQVVIGKADVEEAVDITAKYGVRNIPTVIFIKDGKVVDKVVGAAAKNVYEEKIKALL